MTQFQLRVLLRTRNQKKNLVGFEVHAKPHQPDFNKNEANMSLAIAADVVVIPQRIISERTPCEVSFSRNTKTHIIEQEEALEVEEFPH